MAIALTKISISSGIWDQLICQAFDDAGFDCFGGVIGIVLSSIIARRKWTKRSMNELGNSLQKRWIVRVRIHCNSVYDNAMMNDVDE